MDLEDSFKITSDPLDISKIEHQTLAITHEIQAIINVMQK